MRFDRLSIAGTGTTILSEGSELHEGSRSALWVQHGATLALLQDAFAGTEMTQQRPQCYASMIVGGTLMIGLPDKPIRRDMRFALSGIRKELIRRDPSFSVRSTGTSFVLAQKGRFVIHKVYPGGIIVAPETRAKWKNVFYGENNLAAPEELYDDPNL